MYRAQINSHVSRAWSILPKMLNVCCLLGRTGGFLNGLRFKCLDYPPSNNVAIGIGIAIAIENRFSAGSRKNPNCDSDSDTGIWGAG
jgi:hypothetical protein